MITYEMIIKAQKDLVLYWEEDGKRVIEECAKVVPFNGTSSEFLNYCIICGGNCDGMLLTGIKKLWPNVWEAIPDDMGIFAWNGLCTVLVLCGVDTSEE